MSGDENEQKRIVFSQPSSFRLFRFIHLFSLTLQKKLNSAFQFRIRDNFHRLVLNFEHEALSDTS